MKGYALGTRYLMDNALSDVKARNSRNALMFYPSRAIVLFWIQEKKKIILMLVLLVEFQVYWELEQELAIKNKSHIYLQLHVLLSLAQEIKNVCMVNAFLMILTIAVLITIVIEMKLVSEINVKIDV